jgi:hypothetical protein
MGEDRGEGLVILVRTQIASDHVNVTGRYNYEQAVLILEGRNRCCAGMLLIQSHVDGFCSARIG